MYLQNQKIMLNMCLKMVLLLIFWQQDDGSRHKEENVNKSQIYITTAGWKNSFARPVRGMIGEFKPCEPQNEGVILIRLLIVKAFYKVTLCQAA